MDRRVGKAMKNFLGGRKGTSLIEILVVMVVLLVGIMTVIQMFPTGFRVVRQAESRTIASRLAQQEIERWKNMAANLPDGILPVDASGNVLNDQMPGPPFEGITASGTLGNARNMRWVRGEITPIPIASYFDSGSGQQYGSRYALAFSPIAATYSSGDVTGIDVRSGDLRRSIGNADLSPPYLRAGQYAIDYGNEGTAEFYVAFPPNGLSKLIKYKIAYSYWVEEDDGSGDVQAVLRSEPGQDVDVDAGYDGDWITVEVGGGTPPPGFIELDRHSDTCARGFTFVTNSAPWSPNDPYEFKVPDYIMGVVSFNPLGHGLFEYTASGVKPIQARIDYMISDLRIIREDRVVPAPKAGATEIPVKLSLRFILNIGDPTDNPDEMEYQGLIRDAVGNVLVPLPMLVMDLSTGLRVDVPASAIDFKEGAVRLPLTADLVDYSGATPAVDQSGVELAGRNLRFFYRADGDWSIQCTKAYSSYTRDYGSGMGGLDYRSFRFVANRARLLFAPCEYGKTVVVDYNYTIDGVEHKAVGKACRIDIDQQDPYTGEIFVDLKPPVGAVVANNARIVVTGLSFTVRAIWRDGTAWRHVDMDTDLMRK
jgi:hypothetical protein